MDGSGGTSTATPPSVSNPFATFGFVLAGTVVDKVLPGTPAAEAGVISPGDMLSSVDGEHVTVATVGALLRGPARSVASLYFRNPRGGDYTVRLERRPLPGQAFGREIPGDHLRRESGPPGRSGRSIHESHADATHRYWRNPVDASPSAMHSGGQDEIAAAHNRISGLLSALADREGELAEWRHTAERLAENAKRHELSTGREMDQSQRRGWESDISRTPARDLPLDGRNISQELEAVRHDNSRLREQNASLRSQQRDPGDMRLRHDVVALQDENTGLRAENAQLREENSSLRSENSTLRTQSFRGEQDHTSQQQIAALRDDNRKLRDENISIRSDNSSLRGQLSSQGRGVTEREGQLRQENALLRDEMNQLRKGSQTSEANGERDPQGGLDTTSLRGENTQLRDENSALRSDVVSLRTQLSSLTKREGQLQDETRSLRDEIKALRDQLTGPSSKPSAALDAPRHTSLEQPSRGGVADQQADLARERLLQEEMISSLRDENNQLRSEMEGMRSMLDKTTAMAVQPDSRRLSQELSVANAQIEDLKQTVRLLETPFTAASVPSSSVAPVIQALASALRTVTSDISAAGLPHSPTVDTERELRGAARDADSQWRHIAESLRQLGLSPKVESSVVIPAPDRLDPGKVRGVLSAGATRAREVVQDWTGGEEVRELVETVVGLLRSFESLDDALVASLQTRSALKQTLGLEKERGRFLTQTIDTLIDALKGRNQDSPAPQPRAVSVTRSPKTTRSPPTSSQLDTTAMSSRLQSQRDQVGGLVKELLAAVTLHPTMVTNPETGTTEMVDAKEAFDRLSVQLHDALGHVDQMTASRVRVGMAALRLAFDKTARAGPIDETVGHLGSAWQTFCRDLDEVTAECDAGGAEAVAMAEQRAREAELMVEEQRRRATELQQELSLERQHLSESRNNEARLSVEQTGVLAAKERWEHDKAKCIALEDELRSERERWTEDKAQVAALGAELEALRSKLSTTERQLRDKGSSFDREVNEATRRATVADSRCGELENEVRMERERLGEEKARRAAIEVELEALANRAAAAEDTLEERTSSLRGELKQEHDRHNAAAVKAAALEAELKAERQRANDAVAESERLDGELRSSKNRWGATVASAEERVVSLQRLLADAEDKAESSTTRVAALEAELREEKKRAESDLKQERTRVDNAETATRETGRRLDEATAERTNQVDKAQIAELEANIAALQATVAHLNVSTSCTTSLTRSQERGSSLASQTAELQTLNADWSSSANKLERELAQVQRERDELLRGLEADREQHAARLDDMEMRLNAAWQQHANQKEELERRNGQLQAECGELRGKLSEIRSAARGEGDQLRTHLAAAQERTNKMEDIAQSLQRQLTQAEVKWGELGGENDSLRHQLSQSEREVSAESSRAEALRQQIVRCEAELRSSVEEGNDLRRRLLLATDNLGEMAVEREALQTQLSGCKATMSGKEGEVSALRERLLQAETALLQAKPHAQQAEMLRSQLSQSDERAHALQTELNSLRDKLIQSQTSEHAAGSQLAQANERAQAFESLVGTLRDQISQAEGRAMKVMQEAEDARVAKQQAESTKMLAESQLAQANERGKAMETLMKTLHEQLAQAEAKAAKAMGDAERAKQDGQNTDSLRFEVAQAQERANALEGEMKGLRENAALAETQRLQSKTAEEIAATRLAQAQEQITAMETANVKLNEQLAKALEEAARVTQSGGVNNEAMQKQLAETQAREAKLEAEVKDFRAQIETNASASNDRLKAMEELVAASARELELATRDGKDAEGLRKQLEAANHKVATLREAASLSDALARKSEREAEALREQAASSEVLQEELEKMKERASVLDQENAALRATAGASDSSGLEVKLAEAMATVDARSREITALQAKVAEAHAGAEQLRRDNAELPLLLQRLRALELDNDKLTEQVRVSASAEGGADVEGMRTQLAESQAREDEAETRLAVLVDQFVQERDKVDQLEELLEEAKRKGFVSESGERKPRDPKWEVPSFVGHELGLTRLKAMLKVRLLPAAWEGLRVAGLHMTACGGEHVATEGRQLLQVPGVDKDAARYGNQAAVRDVERQRDALEVAVAQVEREHEALERTCAQKDAEISKLQGLLARAQLRVDELEGEAVMPRRASRLEWGDPITPDDDNRSMTSALSLPVSTPGHVVRSRSRNTPMSPIHYTEDTHECGEEAQSIIGELQLFHGKQLKDMGGDETAQAIFQLRKEIAIVREERDDARALFTQRMREVEGRMVSLERDAKDANLNLAVKERELEFMRNAAMRSSAERDHCQEQLTNLQHSLEKTSVEATTLESQFVRARIQEEVLKKQLASALARAEAADAKAEALEGELRKSREAGGSDMAHPLAIVGAVAQAEQAVKRMGLVETELRRLVEGLEQRCAWHMARNEDNLLRSSALAANSTRLLMLSTASRDRLECSLEEGVSRQHELSKRVGVLDEELASAYSLIDSLHRDKTASPGPTGGEMQGQVLSDAIGEAMTTVEELAALQTRLATLDMALQRAEAKEKEAAEEAVRLAQELEAARLGWGEERRAAGEALGVAQERMREMAAALEMVQEESEGLQRDLVQVLTPPSSTAVSPTQLLSPGVTSPGPTPRLQTHPVAMFSGEVVASSPEPPQLTSQSSRSPPVRITATPARQEAEEVVGDAVAAAVATASSSPQLSQHTKVGVAKEIGDTVADMIMEWALQAHGEKRPR